MSRPRRIVEPADYHAYIRSPEWAAVKKRYRASRLPQTCIAVVGRSGKKRTRCHAIRVDLHHKTYKNLGNERLNDLVPLCREHHQRVHDLQQQTELGLWGCTNAVIRNTKMKHVVKMAQRKSKTVVASGRTRPPQDT